MTNLDLKVVHGVHGQGLNDFQVFVNGLSTREVVQHPIVLDNTLLTGEQEGLNVNERCRLGIHKGSRTGIHMGFNKQ